MYSLFRDLMQDVLEVTEAKEVGLELEHFQIKVFGKDIVESYIEILITAKDPCDCVEMAWRIIDKLRQMDYKPEVLILP